MKERRRNILIGLFVLGGIVCLTVLILLFGAFPNVISGRAYKVTVYFAGPVEYVPVETDVFMMGKRIGRTVGIDWRSGDPSLGVEAVAEVEQDIRIPVNAVAEFKGAALGFGRPSISILVPQAPETAPLPTDGSAVIPGKVVGAFEQIIPKEMGVTLQQATARIGELAQTLTPAARDLHDLLKPTSLTEVGADQAMANVSTVVQRMDRVLANVNDVIGEPAVKQNLIATVENMRSASEQLQTALVDIQAFAAAARDVADGARDLPEEVQALLADTRARIDRVARNITTNTDNLDKVLVGLDQVVQKVNRGEGTLGSLLTDNSLYEALLLTIRRLGATIQDLQALIKAWEEEGVKIERLNLR